MKRTYIPYVADWPALACSESWELVSAEVENATKKFPKWPTDPLHALAILGEEFGELTKEVVQMIYEPNKTSTAKIREEAIQTAAMAIRFVMSLDSYCYLQAP